MGAPQYEQAGADIGGTGTPNTIPRWTGASTLGDSGLIDNGTAVYTTARDVGIGTTSPASRLDVAGTITCDDAGTGLKLPATPGNTDPNTLDCYADGGTANSGGVTWTPELRFGGATTGITYNARVGRYTRIGNMVFAQCHINLSSKGTAVGAMSIAGLPTSANVTNMFGANGVYTSNVTFGGYAVVVIPPNSGSVEIYKNTSGGGAAVMFDTDFQNNSSVIFTIAYPVT